MNILDFKAGLKSFLQRKKIKCISHNNWLRVTYLRYFTVLPSLYRDFFFFLKDNL